MKKIYATATGILAATSPAAAASRADDGEYGVWVFLAFCAFIVAGQLLPLLGSLRKSVKETKENVEKEEAKETVRG